MDAKVDDLPRSRSVPLPGRGGAMHALDFGPKDRAVDIVFSHANGFNARTYRTILAPLAAELRILAIDLRGHGATTLPTVVEGREGWTLFRDDLLAFLETQGQAGPVVLAGHSMGGTSSLLAAAKAPERVKALVLFDPVIFEEAALEAYRGRGAFRTWSEAPLADYVADGFRDTPTGEVTLACPPEWEASSYRTHNYDPWAALAESRCPIRLLRAETGSTALLDQRLEALTADGRIVVETVAGTSHFLPMERPDLVQAALRTAVA
jgi:pimeloyl-ACP methyl ester carboxylesterase